MSSLKKDLKNEKYIKYNPIQITESKKNHSEVPEKHFTGNVIIHSKQRLNNPDHHSSVFES